MYIKLNKEKKMNNYGMIKCDRCGKEIGFCDEFRTVLIDGYTGRLLCIKCYNKFQKFNDNFFTSYNKTKGKKR